MRITREMYSGAADPYTDLLDIVTRSLGANPMQVSLRAAIEKSIDRGESGSQAVNAYRIYLEGFLERAFAGLEAAGG